MHHRQVEGGRRTDACPGGGLDAACEAGGVAARELGEAAPRDGDRTGRGPGLP